MRGSSILLILLVAIANLDLTSANGIVVTEKQGQQHDFNITHQIRMELRKDHSLSSRAKKVKIRVQYGDIVLTGTVPSDWERSKINSIVKKCAMETRVLDHLAVKNN